MDPGIPVENPDPFILNSIAKTLSENKFAGNGNAPGHRVRERSFVCCYFFSSSTILALAAKVLDSASMIRDSSPAAASRSSL